jgi:hypothetical protein
MYSVCFVAVAVTLISTVIHSLKHYIS